MMAIEGGRADPWIECVKQVVAFMLMLALLIALSPVLVSFWVYRRILKAKIHNKLGDQVTMASGDDAFYMQDGHDNMSVINVLFTAGGRGDVDIFRNIMLNEIVMADDPKHHGRKLFAKMSSYSTKFMRRYVWLPELAFNINEHVFVHPQACPKLKSDREKLFGEICSTPFPPSKAPWQVILFNYSPSDDLYDFEQFFMFRVHHSIGDGMALLHLLLNRFFGDTPKGFGPAQSRSKPSLFKTLHDIFITPYLILSGLSQPEDKNIFHGQKLSGTKLLASSEPIELELVKKIKNATGTTVNDVLLTCFSTALKNYLASHTTDIPDDILSVVTVSVRRPSSEITLDNQFSSVFVHLPMKHNDTLSMLRDVKSNMDQLKMSPEAVVVALTMRYGMDLLPCWFSQSSFDSTASKATLTFTNVPGPQDRLTVADNPVEDITFWGPQKATIGFGVSIISYCGKLTIGINTDKTVLSQPKVIVDEFVSQIQSLASALKLV